VSPYQLAIGNQKFTLDKSSPQQGAFEGKFMEIQEVGYWMRGGKLLVNLADKNVMRTMVLLQIETIDESAKPETVYKGEAFFEVYEPGVSRKLQMSCTFE
jgi:hypothetical protein